MATGVLFPDSACPATKISQRSTAEAIASWSSKVDAQYPQNTLQLNFNFSVATEETYVAVQGNLVCSFSKW